MKRIVVEVPATTANLGPGFDSLGLALDLWNEFEFTVGPGVALTSRREADVSIACEGEGDGELPLGRQNLVYRAWSEGLGGAVNRAGGLRPESVAVRIRNRVPLSSGLGSSATAIVAGLLAASAWLAEHRPGEAPDRSELIDLATRMEGHPDNVAPAFLGGLAVSVVRGDGSVRSISVAPPPKLWVAVAVPDFYLKTSYSRAKLPTRVTRDEAVFNLSRAALWVAAMATGDLEAIADATEDRLHQPYRSELIPGLSDVFDGARRAGALGVALSGSGPSVAAFCRRERAEAIGDAMAAAFRKVGVTARVFLTRPTPTGARVRVDDAGRAERTG